MTDITTNNGHKHLPAVDPWPPASDGYREPTGGREPGVRGIIESIQGAYDRQCRELDSRDNLIDLLRDELAKVTAERDGYMRKVFEMAQQMKAVAQLCDEGRRLVEIVERG